MRLHAASCQHAAAVSRRRRGRPAVSMQLRMAAHLPRARGRRPAQTAASRARGCWRLSRRRQRMVVVGAREPRPALALAASGAGAAVRPPLQRRPPARRCWRCRRGCIQRRHAHTARSWGAQRDQGRLLRAYVQNTRCHTCCHTCCCAAAASRSQAPRLAPSAAIAAPVMEPWSTSSPITSSAAWGAHTGTAAAPVAAERQEAADAAACQKRAPKTPPPPPPPHGPDASSRLAQVKRDLRNMLGRLFSRGERQWAKEAPKED